MVYMKLKGKYGKVWRILVVYCAIVHKQKPQELQYVQ